MKKSFLLLIILSLLIFPIKGAFAQTKTCDIELRFYNIYNNETFQAGDTANIRFVVINHGPDSILPNDSIYFYLNYYPNITYFYNLTIPNGDSFVSLAYVSFINAGYDTGATFNVCAHLVDQSTTYLDPNKSNDTPACVNIIFEGDTTSGIAKMPPPSSQLTLYPNPATKFTHLSLNLKQPGKVVVKMEDVTGRTIFYKDYGMLQGKEKLKIDVSALPSGMYFIHLSEGAKQVTGKLVVR